MSSLTPASGTSTSGTPASGTPTSATSLEVQTRLAAPALAAQPDGSLCLRWPTDGLRPEAQLEAQLLQPLLFRELLLALGEILGSDLRRKASDRSDYLKWLATQGKKASQELWNAQKAYLASTFGETQRTERPLDPLLTVSELGLSLEVLSSDESSYACLRLKPEALGETQWKAGTSTVQLTPELLQQVGTLRSFRETRLSVAPTEQAESTSFAVPLRWLRTFGQLQQAASRPTHCFELAPIDLYNVLTTLRLRRARKGTKALRYELTPGETPRIVLEPWGLVLTGQGAAYAGRVPLVVRTWGRLRLATLGRLLPYVQRLQVHVQGAGQPVFYVLDFGSAELTLALSGWTDQGWAGLSLLDEVEGADHALLARLRRGEARFDVASGRAIERPLLAVPVADELLRYRDPREAEAFRLLAGEGQVRLTRITDMGVEGLRIDGEIEDRLAHRTYKSFLVLDGEGRTVQAGCSSPAFRRSGLKEGPTPTLIALRIAYARERVRLEAARHTEAGRRLIRAESRLFLKRSEAGACMHRVALDARQVVQHWGLEGQPLRKQRSFFGTEEEARQAYFDRLGALSEAGYLDMTQATAI